MTDNRDILNEAEVDFLLQTAGPDAEREIPNLDDVNQTVTMHGDLDQIHLADIFQTLAMSKMEGVLRVRNPLEERQIYCFDGYVRILAPARVTLRRLGQRLVQAGLLRADELRAALVEQAKAKIPLGQLLVRDEIIHQADLDNIIGMQVSEDLFALFTWRHGTFEFFKGDPNNPVLRDQYSQCPEYEINCLLLEVARRSDEWGTIIEAVRSLDEIPQQIAQPANPDDLEEAHLIVLKNIDGKRTFRQLADQTTIGLFGFSRAARDLTAGNIIGLIDDQALIDVASELGGDGDQKRAIVVLQTLRDRPGDRSLTVIKSMAEVLEQAGERRFASSMLLAAAQRSPIADEALELARAARALVSYDAATLSFLRTALLAQSSPDSAELEKCTIDLLDALIDGDLIPTALEIIEDARRTDTMRPQILMREARARQKAKDVEGAITTLLELTEHYKGEGNRAKAIESLQAIQRLDRTRKDVQKTLAAMHRTRIGMIVRASAALLVMGLIAAMGVVWWQQSAFEDSLQNATREVQTLLEQGDRVNARKKLDSWAASLGDCDGIQDLASRVAFAESSEKNRLKKLQRARSNQKLTEAATALGRGHLTEALDIYTGVHEQRGMQKEVREVVRARMNALIDEMLSASKTLRAHLPPNPGELFDRAEVTTNLATLRSTCSPVLVSCFDTLSTLSSKSELPSFIDDETKERIAATLKEARPDIEDCRRLSLAYTKALERNDIQRRLDPMFKAAVEMEAKYNFAGALKLYRELEAQPTDDKQLRTHFRDQVTRNATITRLMKALQHATNSADYGTATQHLRALRLSFPKVPFDSLVRLPIRVTSEPKNATVVVNDTAVGPTPVVLSRVPAEQTSIVVSSEGFVDLKHEISGDADAQWTAKLTLQPIATWHHKSAIETPPATTPNGSEVFVDRSGKIILQSANLDQTAWTFVSDDLSGWLTTPVLDNNQVVVGSIDGTVRAINLKDGKLAWSLDELPCEVQPALIGRTLALATTDGRLHAIDLAERHRQSINLPEVAFGRLIASSQNVIAVGTTGTVSCWSVPALKMVWQQKLARVQGPRASLDGPILIVGDDQGKTFGLDAANGTIKWQRDLEMTMFGGPTGANHKVLCVAPSRVHRLDTRTGKSLKDFAKGNSDWAGVATVVGNRMIIPVRGGSLQVLDAETGQPLYLMVGDSRSRILATQGRVFVTAGDHTVRSYGQLR